MDSTNIMSLLEQLDDEMDDLEESLSPLIKTALSETAAKLPLLQKAKTFTLVTYAIESMLFCKYPKAKLQYEPDNINSVSATQWC
jgi:exosome complex protein LRP1